MPGLVELTSASNRSREIVMLQAMNLEPKFFELFREGLNTGILSPREIASVLPKKAKKNEQVREEILDWLLNCLQLLEIRVITIETKQHLLGLPEEGDGEARTEQTKKGASHLEYITDKLHKDVVPEKDLLGMYLKEISKFPLLKPSEEKELAAVVVKNDQQAREKFIAANLRLPLNVARRYRGRGLEYLDLIQEGNVGLIRATDRFEHWRGYKFSGYAVWWIRQAITRAIYEYAEMIRLPVHETSLRNRILKASIKLVQEKGREPKAEEIAQKIYLPVDEVERTLRRMRLTTVYLEDLISSDGNERDGDESGSWEKVIGDSTALRPDTYVLAKEKLEEIKKRIQMINAALYGIGPRFQRIFRLRFGLDGSYSLRTLQKVADECGGITRERIRQILERTFKILQDWGIREDHESLVASIKSLGRLQEIVSQIDGEAIFNREEVEKEEVQPEEAQTTRPRYKSLIKKKAEIKKPKYLPKIILRKGGAPDDVEKIIKDVASDYGFSVADILAKKRTKEVALARQRVMYVLREEYGFSFPQIAQALNRDHTTVMHGYKHIKEELTKSQGGIKRI